MFTCWTLRILIGAARWLAANRASIHYLLGNEEAASADFEQATQLDQTDGRAWWLWGLTFREQKQYERTREKFAEAITRNRRRYDVWFLQGLTSTSLQDLPAARLESTQAIELSPYKADAYVARAKALFQAEDYEKSLEDLRRIKEFRPSFYEMFSWIPAKDVKDCPDASFRKGLISLADELVANNFDDPRTYLSRAKLLSGLGETDRADEDTARGKELSEPNSTD